MSSSATPKATADKPVQAYARLEDRMIGYDQVGASDIFYDLVRAQRPLTELVGEIVRIHAPYTHVPYHQRMDDGLVKFVNNDHCLLSSGATLRLWPFLPDDLKHLAIAQTVWYVPTGLDPWNQLLGKVPGHYVRLYQLEANSSPPPQVHWPDQEPLYEEGPTQERLNNWLSLVQRGEVLTAYRVFLGLIEDEANRQRVLAQYMFAGLIDIQDRMLYNRSYTTGHKSYRARATIQIAEAVGWENAHHIFYAGVPDIAVGPRWYSTFEMGSNVVQQFLDGKDAELMPNRAGLSKAEAKTLTESLRQEREPVWTEQITRLLKAGKGPRQILDVMQIAAADVILDTGREPNALSMPQHAAEYLNHLRWFYDNFTHPHQVKLLYVAGSFVNQASHHQASTPGNGPHKIRRPRGVDALPQQQLLQRINESITAQDPDQSVALTAAYLNNSFDRAPLIETLAVTAAQAGNDPHNQEIGICLIEDYRNSTAAQRDRLLLACAKHTAGHRKYGEWYEPYRRYAAAFGLSA